MVNKTPNYFACYYDRGEAYLKAKKYQEAIKDFTASLTYNPRWSPAYLSRAKAHYYCGDYVSARSDLEKFFQSGMPDKKCLDEAYQLLDELDNK